MKFLWPLGLFLCLPALAAPSRPIKSPENSIREMAEQEAQGRPEKSSRTDTGTTGSLPPDQSSLNFRLKDGYLPLTTRKFLWTFGFAVTSFESFGKQDLNSQVSQDLSRENRAQLYSVNFGYLSEPEDAQQWGAEAEFGAGSQRVSVPGLQASETEARLTTFLTEARGFTRWGKSDQAPWHFRVGAGLGRLQQTQTSDFEMARFSREQYYFSALGAIDYRLARNWVAQFNYRVFSFPTSQFGLGVQTLW